MPHRSFPMVTDDKSQIISDLIENKKLRRRGIWHCVPEPLPFTKQLKLIFRHYYWLVGRACQFLKVRKIYITVTDAQTNTPLTSIAEWVKRCEAMCVCVCESSTYFQCVFIFVISSHVQCSQQQNDFWLRPWWFWLQSFRMRTKVTLRNNLHFECVPRRCTNRWQTQRGDWRK